MAFKLSGFDESRLDRLIEKLLTAYATGEVSLSQVTFAVGHLIKAAAADDENTLKSWLIPATSTRWTKFARDKRAQR
jgi:hypothetical protein